MPHDYVTNNDSTKVISCFQQPQKIAYSPGSVSFPTLKFCKQIEKIILNRMSYCFRYNTKAFQCFFNRSLINLRHYQAACNHHIDIIVKLRSRLASNIVYISSKDDHPCVTKICNGFQRLLCSKKVCHIICFSTHDGALRFPL